MEKLELIDCSKYLKRADHTLDMANMVKASFSSLSNFRTLLLFCLRNHYALNFADYQLPGNNSGIKFANKYR